MALRTWGLSWPSRPSWPRGQFKIAVQSTGDSEGALLLTLHGVSCRQTQMKHCEVSHISTSLHPCSSFHPTTLPRRDQEEKLVLHTRKYRIRRDLSSQQKHSPGHPYVTVYPNPLKDLPRHPDRNPLPGQLSGSRSPAFATHPTPHAIPVRSTIGRESAAHEKEPSMYERGVLV